MTAHRHFHASDWHGASRLLLSAVEGVIGLAEEVHGNIAGALFPRAGPGGFAGLPWRGARYSLAQVRQACDALLARSGDELPTPARRTVLAVLNGLVGDVLAQSGNPLALAMHLRSGGVPLALQRDALARALPDAGGRLLLLAHGLCQCDLQWRRNRHDHGAALARELGYVPLRLCYNSGLHVSWNGRALAGMMETLLCEWPAPIEEIALLGYSMGGLVLRSAFHYGRLAEHAWPGRIDAMIFLGTPHHGTPLERGGNWLGAVLGRNPWTAPFSRLGRMRSAGITDLRYGNLLDEDWSGGDRFAHAPDRRLRMPLPHGVRCYAIAATLGRRVGDLRDRMLGDGLVPVDSALGRHGERGRNLRFPASHRWIAHRMHHLDLLGRVEVYRRIRDWLA